MKSISDPDVHKGTTILSVFEVSIHKKIKNKNIFHILI